jgi:hypothetical protein
MGYRICRIGEGVGANKSGVGEVRPMMRAPGRTIGKLMRMISEFRPIEIVVLLVAAVLILTVAIHGYWGSSARGHRAMGDELLSALRGTNGMIYAAERR